MTKQNVALFGMSFSFSQLQALYISTCVYVLDFLKNHDIIYVRFCYLPATFFLI